MSLVAANSEIQTGAVSLLSITTLVVWCGVLTVGVTGASLAYPHPRPSHELPAVQAELLEVTLTEAKESQPRESPESEENTLEIPEQDAVNVPPLPAVAKPTPAVAFALPVPGPVEDVDTVIAASYQPPAPLITNVATRAESNTPAANGGRERLVMGRGDGVQPAPEYPRRAVLEGQEGEVLVRFSVGERGRVIAAELIKPSPWPLLNEAAVRAIRQRWRFQPGSTHLYDVVIRFQLED